MKLFISSLVLFLAANAQASMPSVNDVSHLVGTYTSQGKTLPTDLKLSVLSFDAASQTYMVQQVYSLAGSVAQDEQKPTSAAEMISDAFINDVLTNCMSYGGTIEQITVAAGSFQTCRLTSNDSSSSSITWVGYVPFGIVKAEIHAADGSYDMTFDLADYQFGQ